MNGIFCDNNLKKHINNRLRFAAYTTVTSFIYGKFGKGNRRVVPSYIVGKVRDKYPSADGMYKGFKDFIPQHGS